MSHKKLSATERKEQILKVAMQAAEAVGYRHITRDYLAVQATVSPSLIQYHFNTMDDLRGAIVARAVETKNYKIIAQVVTAANEMVIDPELRREALAHIAAEG